MDDVDPERAPYIPDSSTDLQSGAPETIILKSNTRPKLLIVDDDENIQTQMKWAFNDDYEVLLAQDRKTGLELFNKQRPGLVTLDLGLPPDAHGVNEGFGLLSEILNLEGLTKVILLTGQTAKEHALRGIGQGAYDFVCKPIEVKELEVILRRAFYVHQLEQGNRALQRMLESGPCEGMLGVSPQMQQVFALMRKVATSEVSVLIVGESGVGKELVARGIHKQSSRKNGPFIPINCGAIPETLLESELFGHEKGAFTGAHIQRRGRIESAQGGTLFLDEIGEMPPTLQVKLLRFLQERRIERIGGREEISVDTRVLVATNKDLKEAISRNGFREDLYYRLAVVTIPVPPLRERPADILLIAKELLRRYAAEAGRKINGFTHEAVAALKEYSWPGNIRELENRIKRGVIMTESSRLTALDLELAAPTASSDTLDLQAALDVVRKKYIEEALSRHQGNLTLAAAALGVSRPTLYDHMEKVGLRRKEWDAKR